MTDPLYPGNSLHNWGENPDLSGPMAGSFHVKTKSGPQGRIGVMPFRENVSTVDVANMFGREMGYPPFTQENLTPLLQEKKIGDRTFEWVYLNSKVETASSPPRTALLALVKAGGEDLALSLYRRSKIGT